MRHAVIATIVFVTIVLLTRSTLAQSHEWGLVVSAAISKGRLPSGVGVSYAGPPFWSGNLVVEERNVPGFAIEIFREQLTRWNRVSAKTGFGFLTCGAYQHFDYDYANSFNNIISIENRFRYITLNALVKYSLPINKATVFASLGPHFGHMIYSKETSINYVANGGVRRGVLIFYRLKGVSIMGLNTP